jgi:putative ABC transport system permease protein
MNDLTLIRKNLFRKKLRAILMIVSIVIAFAIFGVLAAFQSAFYSGEDVAQADRLVVVNKINFTQPLPISYFNRIGGVEGVRDVTHLNWFGGYYQDPKNFLVVLAVEPESWMRISGADFVFTDEMRQSFIRNRTGVLVGERMAQQWGWKVGDHIPLSSSIFSQKNGSHSWDFTVVGIFAGLTPQNDTNFAVFHYSYFDETRSFGKDQIGWLTLQTTSSSMNEKVIGAIDTMFANSPYETATDTEKAFNKGFMAQIGNIALIVGLVVGAAFLTILMIVGNTMAMAVRERTREIAVLKTLGFSDGHILRLVLGESLLLALIGGLVGLGLAALAIWSMRQALMNFVPTMSLEPEIVATAIALMLALGLLTGLMPALGAMRLKIADALGRS